MSVHICIIILIWVMPNGVTQGTKDWNYEVNLYIVLA